MLVQGLPAEKERIIVPGPAGFMPPSAAQLGVALPPSGVGIAYGHHTPEDIAIAEIARQMLTKPNATIFPGPSVLWAWNAHALGTAMAVLAIAAGTPNAL